MIKTILVTATGEQTDFATFGLALGIARALTAHIDVLYVRLDAVDTAVSMISDASGGMLVEGLIDQLERDARERETKAKRLFDEFCLRESLAILDSPTDREHAKVTAQWHVETGDEARTIAGYGMAADLIIASRGTEIGVTARSVLEAALLETGRPLLIPSAATAAPMLGGTIAIAWKPTPQAARAVAAAMPFITCAKDIVVMTVEEQFASDYADRLIRNLAWHGCHARAELLKLDGRDAVEVLLAAAKERAAGLLVMGGYGHSRLREWVFGGFTQLILDDAPLPVLMAH